MLGLASGDGKIVKEDGITLVYFIIWSALCWFLYVRKTRMEKKGNSTIGSVTALDLKAGSIRLEVKYRDQDDKERLHISNYFFLSKQAPSFSIGDEVKILYVPSKPGIAQTQAEIDDVKLYWQSRTVFIGLIILGLLSLYANIMAGADIKAW